MVFLNYCFGNCRIESHIRLNKIHIYILQVPDADPSRNGCDRSADYTHCEFDECPSESLDNSRNVHSPQVNETYDDIEGFDKGCGEVEQVISYE